MGPYKCPDCGIWWAGFEHRCRVMPDTNTTNSPPYITYIPTRANPFCSICGRVHTMSVPCVATSGAV